MEQEMIHFTFLLNHVFSLVAFPSHIQLKLTLLILAKSTSTDDQMWSLWHLWGTTDYSGWHPVVSWSLSDQVLVGWPLAGVTLKGEKHFLIHYCHGWDICRPDVFYFPVTGYLLKIYFVPNQLIYIVPQPQKTEVLKGQKVYFWQHVWGLYSLLPELSLCFMLF